MRFDMSLVGLIFVVGGIYGIASRKRKTKRDEIFLGKLLDKKPGQILIIIIGVMFILIGLNILLKGLFDPTNKSFWVHF